MKKLLVIAIAVSWFSMFQSPRPAEASCTGGSVCLGSSYYQKGEEEVGKVWYQTVFAGTTPPAVASKVFGIQSTGTSPAYTLSDTVDGES